MKNCGTLLMALLAGTSPLLLGRAQHVCEVPVLGENIPVRVENSGGVSVIITNFPAMTADNQYERSDWLYSDSGYLTCVKKYSKIFKEDLTGLEKRRMMSGIQHQMAPGRIHRTSTLKEWDDDNGEIVSEAGLTAKVTFVNAHGGIQMIVDVVIKKEYLDICEAEEEKCREESVDLLDFVCKLFKLTPLDVSTNDVGICGFYTNGRRNGFRFARPKMIKNERFDVLMCSFFEDGRLNNVSLVKFVSGEEWPSACLRLMESLERDLVRALGLQTNISRLHGADNNFVVSMRKGSVCVEISMKTQDKTLGIVSLNITKEGDEAGACKGGL